MKGSPGTHEERSPGVGPGSPDERMRPLRAGASGTVRNVMCGTCGIGVAAAREVFWLRTA